MTGIKNKETHFIQGGVPTRIKDIALTTIFTAATIFLNGCGNDSTKENQQQPNTEQKTPKGNYYCETINDISKLIKEEDGKKYIDEIYHYPITEKDGKTYLIYNNTEYELKYYQRVNENNKESYSYGLENGGVIYQLVDNKIHKGEIMNNMGITTDGKFYSIITDCKTKQETFVFNGEGVAKLDHILKAYWNGPELPLLVIGNNYDEEGNIKYKLIIDGKEYDIDSPYEKVNLDLRGKFLEEGVSLAFYEKLLSLIK